MKKLLSYEEFVNESYQLITESFRSTILQSIVSNKSINGKEREFFDALSRYGISASEITDYQIITIEPDKAAKYTKHNPSAVLIYYSTKEKRNPYKGEYFYNENDIPKNRVLAVVKNSVYVALEYKGSKKSVSSFIKPDSRYASSLGINTSGGKYGSGLTNLKRMAEVSDVVYVIDPDRTPSSKEIRNERVESRRGALALKDPKLIKQENISRYEEIIKERRFKESSIDGKVQETFNTLNKQLQDAIELNKFDERGNLIIGKSKKDKNIYLSDMSSITSKLLSSYSSYIRYMNDFEIEKNRESSDSLYVKEKSWYLRAAKNEILTLDKIQKEVEAFNYAW